MVSKRWCDTTTRTTTRTGIEAMVRYYYDYTYWYRSDGAILLRLHVLVSKRWCDTTTRTYDYTYWYRSDGAILLRLHVMVSKRWCDTTTTTRTGNEAMVRYYYDYTYWYRRVVTQRGIMYDISILRKRFPLIPRLFAPSVPAHVPALHLFRLVSRLFAECTRARTCSTPLPPRVVTIC